MLEQHLFCTLPDSSGMVQTWNRSRVKYQVNATREIFYLYEKE